MTPTVATTSAVNPVVCPDRIPKPDLPPMAAVDGRPPLTSWSTHRHLFLALD